MIKTVFCYRPSITNISLLNVYSNYFNRNRFKFTLPLFIFSFRLIISIILLLSVIKIDTSTTRHRPVFPCLQLNNVRWIELKVSINKESCETSFVYNNVLCVTKICRNRCRILVPDIKLFPFKFLRIFVSVKSYECK